MVAQESLGGLARLPDRRKLADEVVDTLRQALLRGDYEPGERLGMDEIAAQLGVSAMPVREALVALANEGLVRAEPRRGFRARPLDEQDLDDLFEIQAHLSGILASRAAAVITPEQVAQLRRIHRSIESACRKPRSVATMRRIFQLNDEFHQAVHRIPPGDRVRWFLRMTSRFVREDLYEAVPGIVEGSLNDHPRIIDALEKGRAELARKLSEEHFLQGAELSRKLRTP